MNETKELVKVDNGQDWDEALKNESWISPRVNIYETDDDFDVVAYMPEVNRDNVRIKIEDGSLVIMGRIDFTEASNRKYILNEFAVGNFYRKFNLSDTIDTEKIEAKFDNGLLSIKLPKHDRVKPRTIEIN